jgi:hypothetical protein
MTPSHLAAALLMVLVWGFNFVVIRWGLEVTPPLLLTFLRFLVAARHAVGFLPRAGSCGGVGDGQPAHQTHRQHRCPRAGRVGKPCEHAPAAGCQPDAGRTSAHGAGARRDGLARLDGRCLPGRPHDLARFRRLGVAAAQAPPAPVIAPFALLVPVSGMASAAIFLGEPLPWWKLAGAGLVLTGLAMNVFGGRFLPLRDRGRPNRQQPPNRAPLWRGKAAQTRNKDPG